jgi:serine/threonine-protein kinase
VTAADDRWLRVKALFADAIELPLQERDTFLDRACGMDVELRQLVVSLLSHADGADEVPGAPTLAPGILERMRLVSDDPSPTPPSETRGESRLHSMLETALGTQYEIVRTLGRGGMGAVYLARERALERFVAIKVLRADLAESPEGRERFRREARIAAQLSHPSILPLHTFGEVGGIWYFVMSYVRGVTLADRLRAEGRLPNGDAHRILAELADALECAHRNGVIHRDIKPANVLLDEESGRAVLADFGISKVRGGGDSLTAAGMVIGTPSFMSPEQLAGSDRVDERSDIYSLGAVGYSMLAGREPFESASADAAHVRRARQEPPPLAGLAPGVSPELVEIVTRCMARDPALRWPSARALKEALARAAGDSGSTLPDSMRELPTFGPYALLWSAVWIALAARPFRPTGDRVLLLFIALLIPVGLVLHVWNVSDDGLSLRELARVAFWPPEWWGMWWPRALRRPADLWRRLPWPARALRVVLSAFIVALPVVILMREWVKAIAGAPPAGMQDEWVVTTEAILVAVAAAAVAGAVAWALRRGLSLGESVRVLFGATAPSPRWTSPAVARLLAPAAGGVRPPARDTPAELLRAIADLAERRTSANGAASSASAAAHLLHDAIAACDVEIAALARDASAAELDRLSAQLGELESADGESAERAELAALVRGQLDVVRRMRVRFELVSQRRTMLFLLMRGLWAQLLAAHQAGVSSPEREGRVRALCSEIGKAVAG